MKKIPFDALTLAGVCTEIESFVGGKCQGVRQPDDRTIVLELYRQGRVAHLLLSCHANHFRVHLTHKRPPVPQTPPAFCAALRARINEQTLEGLRMKSGDRVLILEFGEHRLIAELMGKHSNLILIDADAKIVAAALWVGASKSKRPILPNREYFWPPVLKNGPDITDFSDFSRLNSHVASRVLDQMGLSIPLSWSPGFASGIGAYPLDLGSILPTWVHRETLSMALENFYSQSIPQDQLLQKRNSLVAQLERVLLAREVSLKALYEAREAGGRAAKWQRFGELLLAFRANGMAGEAVADLQDYDGTPVTIPLNSELSAKENALHFFERAKKAKGRMGMIEDQIHRLESDKEQVEGVLYKVYECQTLSELEGCQELAVKKRWLHLQISSGKEKEDRPFEGHRIKEVMGPDSSVILYGENAEGNDYLTLRVAKGNDWWLHVRGHTSAHVIIRTFGTPEKVGKNVLEFAARIAVQNSPMKHSGFVPVDITLKKYVRKPRGAAKGTVLYSNEKTIHVDGK